jgi:hypothetical protein
MTTSASSLHIFSWVRNDSGFDEYPDVLIYDMGCLNDNGQFLVTKLGRTRLRTGERRTMVGASVNPVDIQSKYVYKGEEEERLYNHLDIRPLQQPILDSSNPL